MPQSVGYKGSKNFGEFIVDSLKQVADWIIGLNSYLLRIVIVGWTAVIENIVLDGIFDLITGTGVIAEDESQNKSWLERKISDFGVKIETAQRRLDNKTTVTVENMVYNQVPFLDANIFNLEEAGGEKIQKGSVLEIIRTNVAGWYYTFRIIGIAVMLVILIYLGFRLALFSVGEQKAIYKQMLVGWVVGFILLFVMHYIMIIVLQLNQSVVELLKPGTNGDIEYSMYETVRSMAYEIKASTGWAGTIMYIVLVYYAIRFLYVYLKRLFNIIILVVLSPLVAISYAVEKVNKKGKTKGDRFTNWLKDFTHTVAMQSIHALIYTVFIATVLKLTQVSVIGIILSFVCLNFMLDAEKIFSQIFGFGNGTKLGRGFLPKAITGGIVASKVGKYYGKYVKKVSTPVRKLGKDAANIALRPLDNAYLKSDKFKTLTQGKTKEQRDELYKKYVKKRNKSIKTAAKLTGTAVKGVAQAAITIPAFIVEPGAGIAMMSKAYGSYSSFNKSVKKIKGFKRPDKRKTYKLAWNYKSNYKQENVVREILKYLNWNGVNYTTNNGRIYVLDKNGIWKMLSSYRKLDPNTNNIFSKKQKESKYSDYRIANNEIVELLDENGEIIESPVSKTSRMANSTIHMAKDVVLTLSGFAFMEDLIEVADILEEDVDKSYQKVNVLNEALKEEDKLIDEYKDSIEKEQILVNTRGNTPFGERLREKQVEQFNNTVEKLITPIAFEYIKLAVDNYKKYSAEEVTERINEGVLENNDYKEIAKELNLVLESNGSDVRVDEDIFTDKVKLAVEATKQVVSDEEFSKKTRTKNRRKDKRKEYLSSPNSEENPNAPKQNRGGSQEDSNNQNTMFGQDVSNNSQNNMTVNDLISTIRNATAQVEVKQVEGATENHIKVANILNEMKETNKKAKKLTKKNIWKMDNILEKLKNNYMENESQTEVLQ